MSKSIAIYKGYMLFCDDYPDDEGFYKKDYWMKSVYENGVRKELPNGSSYTEYQYAVNEFYQYVDRLIKVPVDEKGNPTSVGWMPSYEGEDPPF